jgi:hypothetical protein
MISCKFQSCFDASFFFITKIKNLSTHCIGQSDELESNLKTKQKLGMNKMNFQKRPINHYNVLTRLENS